MPRMIGTHVPDAKPFEDMVIQHNLAMICESMQKARIAAVFVHLDGYDDTGMVDRVTYAPGENADHNPVEGLFMAGDAGPPHTPMTVMTIREAVEHMALDIFDRSFGGWELDDGSLGRVTIQSDGQLAAYWLDRQDEIAFEGVQTTAAPRSWAEMTAEPENDSPGLG